MDAIRHTLTTTATAHDIVEALTTEEGLKNWWGRRTSIEGDRVVMTFTKEGRDIIMRFRIDRSANPVGWTCIANGNPAWVGTKLEWRIDDDNGHRTVAFAHTGFEMGGPPYESTVETWKHFVLSLEHYLDSGRGRPRD